MKTLTRLAALLAAAGLVACENPSKVPAEAALKSAETALAAVGDEAARLAPDELKAVTDGLAAAKAKFTSGKYQEALGAASDLGAKVKGLGEAVKARKDELTKAWSAAAAAVPEMMGAVQARIAELSAMKKLPKEIGAEALAKAKEEAAAVGAAWEKAQAAFRSGALAEAVAQVRGLPERAHGIMDRLGMHKH